MIAPALIDTDIFSETMRAKNPVVVANARNYRRRYGHYTISSITLAELVKGFVRMGREDRIPYLEDHLKDQEILSLDAFAAVLAGRIFGELERTGQPIGRIDPFIAAIALRHGLTLVTGNAKHFQRIVDLGFPLQLANWRD
jgi:tRNA(fMet)-specific endonuclease VapC